MKTVRLNPLRRLAAAVVAAGLMRGLHAIGLDLGPELVNGAADALVVLVAAYVAPLLPRPKRESE